MVSPKVSKPAPRPVAPRHRGHSLAPEHLGERGAAAALVSAIGGIAIFIAAIAMTVSGLTLPGRFTGSSAPPNVSQLGLGEVIGGIALLVLGILIVASAAGLLAGLPRSRPVAAAVAGLTAVLGAVGFVLLLTPTRRDAVLLAALGVAVIAFGGAAVVLARIRR